MCIANGNSFVEIDFGFMNSDLVVQIKLVYIMNFGFITSCNLKCASVGMVVFRPFPIILHFPSFFFFGSIIRIFLVYLTTWRPEMLNWMLILLYFIVILFIFYDFDAGFHIYATINRHTH